MATRLKKAISELSDALGDRPFVLLLDPIHPSSQDRVGFVVEKSGGMAPYTLLGLLECGKIAAREMMLEDRVGHTQRAPVTKPATADRRERETQVLDLLGLVLDFSPFAAAELFNVVMEWTSAEMEEVLAWAGAIHLRASDNDAVPVPPKPDCIPPEWVYP